MFLSRSMRVLGVSRRRTVYPMQTKIRPPPISWSIISKSMYTYYSSLFFYCSQATPLEDNVKCEYDVNCKSHYCGRMTADDDAEKKCCPNGTVSKTYAGFDYCESMPDGATCWSDEMCASKTAMETWGA